MTIKRMLGSGVVLLLLLTSSLSAARSEIAEAASRGDIAAVRALLAQRTDVNAPQADGATALHWAVYRGDKEMTDLLSGVPVTFTSPRNSPFPSTSISSSNHTPPLVLFSRPSGPVSMNRPTVLTSTVRVPSPLSVTFWSIVVYTFSAV